MTHCTGADCFCKKPRAETEGGNSETLEVALKRVPQIAAYLESIKKGDDGVLKMRLAEIRQEKWTVADWNTFAIAARVALIHHSSYGLVISVIQEMGGY